MLLGIDHLVIAVPDPDAAAAALEAALGIAATGGGRHEQVGTFNRLIFLGDTYLELIGVWDRALASGHPIGAAALAALDAGTPGLVTWAIATAAPLAADRPPFLIEHELAGPEWGDEARRARAAFVHPFGGQARVVGLEMAVAHPAEGAAELARTVGVAFRPAPGAEPGDQEAHLGDQSIRLVSSGSGLVSGPEEWPASGPGPTAGDPLARVGIRATAGERLLVDLCGVRFARL